VVCTVIPLSQVKISAPLTENVLRERSMDRCSGISLDEGQQRRHGSRRKKKLF
jgi:hypothetical protein